MRDFSQLLPTDYRDGYRQWREGKPRGAKGEVDKPSRRAVTLVHRQDGHQTKWELHLMSVPARPPPPSRFEDGYAKWSVPSRQAAK